MNCHEQCIRNALDYYLYINNLKIPELLFRNAVIINAETTVTIFLLTACLMQLDYFTLVNCI